MVSYIKGGIQAKGIWEQDPESGDDNGEWKRFHNEELHSLYRSPIVVMVIKSGRLRWAGHIARMEEDKSTFKTDR